MEEVGGLPMSLLLCNGKWGVRHKPQYWKKYSWDLWSLNCSVMPRESPRVGNVRTDLPFQTIHLVTKIGGGHFLESIRNIQFLAALISNETRFQVQYYQVLKLDKFDSWGVCLDNRNYH